MLRVAALAGVVLNFSAHYPHACSYSTPDDSAVPVNQVYRVGNAFPCNVTYFAFPLYGGGVSVTADAAKTLTRDR